jgi:hypothetical protein
MIIKNADDGQKYDDAAKNLKIYSASIFPILSELF